MILPLNLAKSEKEAFFFGWCKKVISLLKLIIINSTATVSIKLCKKKVNNILKPILLFEATDKDYESSIIEGSNFNRALYIF